MPIIYAVYMAKIDKYSIKDLQKEFPTDDVCVDYLFDTLHSRNCSCGGKYSKLKDRRQFQCSKCRFQIAPTAGTIFEKSTTPLTLWFHALFVFSNAKSGISAKEMERQLGVGYKTAWRILNLIRHSLKQDNRKLRGIVEMDEAYFGGKADSQQDSKKNKAVVIAAVERGGEIRANTIPNLKRPR